MRTKHCNLAFEYFSARDKNISYANIADHFTWFDSLPGVMELAPEDRPIKMTFGDDSDITWDDWKLWTKLTDDFGFPIEWQKGVMVCFNLFTL